MLDSVPSVMRAFYSRPRFIIHPSRPSILRPNPDTLDLAVLIEPEGEPQRLLLEGRPILQHHALTPLLPVQEPELLQVAESREPVLVPLDHGHELLVRLVGEEVGIDLALPRALDHAAEPLGRLRVRVVD